MDEKNLRDYTRWTTRALLCFAVAWALSLVPLPFSLLSGVVAIAAIVMLVRSIMAGLRTERRARAVIMGALGILASLLLVAMAGLSAIFYQPMHAIQQCQENAITEQARAACKDSAQDEVIDWLRGGR
ncbi:hypothetical protein M3A96_09460 [Helcobacillus massiliensis]|uniref:Putative membrane protein n=1 Tax=Helcobacillus massiliensis TaxID=521392 RepID=A0A839QSH1_9MICO|nr:MULTISPECIES: hypothetical protein [Helcobacillus]MBB3022982.1 putative membrane protein [Helcobacillus massiliensis]MCG7426168.1 hypothetical protein [Helcobacillus sp. ACRRO]MCT1558338.1 hypothetical protein [Helcobacillus massiliensis]MCT2036564.1 hypothetical protein [Helcobacillus massiliensis]MCT2332333.1 hypothetical protein [Helcobacillus massiliensis]